MILRAANSQLVGAAGLIYYCQCFQTSQNLQTTCRE